MKCVCRHLQEAHARVHGRCMVAGCDCPSFHESRPRSWWERLKRGWNRG